jgi:hypothetical protein
MAIYTQLGEIILFPLWEMCYCSHLFGGWLVLGNMGIDYSFSVKARFGQENQNLVHPIPYVALNIGKFNLPLDTCETIPQLLSTLNEGRKYFPVNPFPVLF